jgi:uncharacterized protein (DUF1800 family)
MRGSSIWGWRLLVVALALASGNALASSDTQALHMLNRLAFGPRPGDVQRVEAMGVDAYIAQQLHPGSIPMPDELQHELATYGTLGMSPTDLFERYGPPERAPGQNLTPEQLKTLKKQARMVAEQAMDAHLLLAIESPRQLQEVMVNFWFNHFNVFDQKGLDAIWVGSYERDAIRPYALGHFRDLLNATARNPAMLFYLDNWLNSEPGTPHARKRFEGINENYARELMELHTLGVDGGYTQQDVTTLAHILTGWGLCPRRGRAADPGAFCFDPKRHDTADQTFLGKPIHGSDEREVEQVLDMLAMSPVTAKHVSYQLAQYFVADNPPPALVNRLVQKWMGSDGDMTAVLGELFQSPEFWSAQYGGNKFKTPYEFVISAVRAQGLSVDDFRPLIGTLRQLGMPLYGCLTPDGYKNTQDAWLNPDGMTLRLSFATALGHGNLPLDTGAMDPDNPEQQATELYATLRGLFSPDEIATIDSQPKELRPALILGSPQFMYR